MERSKKLISYRSKRCWSSHHGHEEIITTDAAAYAAPPLSTSLSTSLRDTPLGERRECERCHCFEIFVRQGISDNRTVAIGQCDRLYVLAAPLTRES